MVAILFFLLMLGRVSSVNSQQYEMEMKTLKPSVPLTFLHGNETRKIYTLSALHYVNITIGIPATSYEVSIHTGTDVSWLQCDPTSTITELGFYNPTLSSTGVDISCDDNICPTRGVCNNNRSACGYEIGYSSPHISTSGIFVEELLYLSSDDIESHPVNAKIVIGCSYVQIGLRIQGLLGLGMSDISIPTALAKQNLIRNSFSLCFSSTGFGRISFGDRGSVGQGETPIKKYSEYPYTIEYDMKINDRVVVGTAKLDSDSSFTYFSEPLYTIVAEMFNSLSQPNLTTTMGLYDYCHERSEDDYVDYPNINLTMKGGDTFQIFTPIDHLIFEGQHYYCLGILKSAPDNLTIIGHNAMMKYRFIFDRERMIIGWKASDCYDNENTLSIDSHTKCGYHCKTGYVTKVLFVICVILLCWRICVTRIRCRRETGSIEIT